MQSKAQMIIQKCVEQTYEFIQWAKSQRWDLFHRSHYDWWAFPISSGSGCYGNTFKVGNNQYEAMKTNKDFIAALRFNAILLSRSWGYNLQKGEFFRNEQRTVDQRWQNWPIRLSKMCKSLDLFGQQDLLKEAIKYSLIILEKQKNFIYLNRDLAPYFIRKYQEIHNLQHANKQERKKEQIRELEYGQTKETREETRKHQETQNRKGIKKQQRKVIAKSSNAKIKKTNARSSVPKQVPKKYTSGYNNISDFYPKVAQGENSSYKVYKVRPINEQEQIREKQRAEEQLAESYTKVTQGENSQQTLYKVPSSNEQEQIREKQRAEKQLAESQVTEKQAEQRQETGKQEEIILKQTKQDQNNTKQSSQSQQKLTQQTNQIVQI